MKIQDCSEFVRGFLNRIGINEGEINPDLETLKKIHTNCFESIPFENLDIMITKTPISLDKDDLWDKIVKRNRGGICYEINYLLCCVLREIGYDVTILSAFVPDSGSEFDHIILVVNLEEPWYVDVALGGNGCYVPIKFIPDVVQSDTKRNYAFIKIKDNMHLFQFEEDGSRTFKIYAFPTPRVIDEFLPRCREFETSPSFIFTKGIICSLAKGNRRVTITEHKFIETIDGEKTVTPIKDKEEFNALLKKHFNIVL